MPWLSFRSGGESAGLPRRLVWGIALGQLIAWGTLYYSFALVIGPMAEELGWSRVDLNFGLTLGLIAASLAAIPVGRWIDRHGGRWAMAGGSAAAALLLALWSQTDSLTVFYLIWIAIGLTHACSLSEAAYNVVAANTGDYRRAVMGITLITGFSSTVTIPFISWVVEEGGWRNALLVLAAVQLLGPALLYWTCLRDTVSTRQKLAQQSDGHAVAHLPLAGAFRDSRLWVMAACFGAQIFCSSGMTFHIIPILQERGYEMAVIAGLLALQGPSQVMARLLVVLLGRTTSTATLGRLSFVMLVVSMLLLCLGSSLGVPGLVVYIMLYGAASGLVIVVRTTSTLEYLGGYGFGTAAGALALATLLPRTGAPTAIAALWEMIGSYTPVLWMIVLLIVGGTAAFWYISGRRA
jgi:MFS family permease